MGDRSDTKDSKNTNTAQIPQRIWFLGCYDHLHPEEAKQIQEEEEKQRGEEEKKGRSNMKTHFLLKLEFELTTRTWGQQ